ncbi:MAG: hypothetical protein ACRDCA_28105 [Serratia sp. (in: enterobacteria)]|uniref:phage tail fiber protein n=1 Tax=Serratia sp. (in: enterobacteria) TaxID=616 RepID=UPI003F31A178
MWYKTGTINLTANNTTVTGIGTAWADAKFGVMPGMILLAPDNKLYEVKQVNSNTSLTLNSNYAGSTASGQSYAIITTYEGDISQFSARFAAMLTFFQGSRNDTVSWFTGSGDMTFTKDDGTKLVVPTLAKIQSDSVSRTLSDDQKVASTVLFSKPTRLSSIATIGFTPSTQGAWVSWGRVGAGDTEGYNGATDFINNRGNGVGGWNFWNSNGTTTNLAAKISPNGYITTVGGLISTGDQVMQAGATTPNLLIRLKDVSGVEKGAVYAQTDTGAMNIRWNGTAYTMACRADGLVSVPKGHIIATALSTPQDVIDIVAANSAPITFRGTDYSGFDKPNNYSIGTWNGFSVIPTIANGLGAGVEQGKPVFFVNARAGTAHVLNNLYIGTKSVIKSGDYGLGGDVLGANNLSDTYRFTHTTGKAETTFFSYEASSVTATVAAGLPVPAWISNNTWGFGLRILRANSALTQSVDIILSNNGRMGYRYYGNGGKDYEFFTTGNTTVDANGFLKKASPIARLTSNPEKMKDEFLDGFTLSGLAAVNGEAAGVTAERVSVGVYKVTGSLGFALEGWNIEVPQDVNGNRLCFVATEADEDGTITVKVSKRRFDIDTAAIVAGEPMDIPEGRWIDLRLEMPPVEEVQCEPEPESNDGEMTAE